MPDDITEAPRRPVDPSVLKRVLARVEALRGSDEKALVIFDLDSTLLNNKPRQARILAEFGSATGVDELTACVADYFVDWSLRKPMLRCGLSEERALSLEPDARRFWRERFFTSEYCLLDRAMPGAADYVKAILDLGATVVYCTGRHPPMREGTIACMAREGFPVPDEQRVYLLMKPEFSMHDDEWKRIARDQLLALGMPVAAFDNEPTHINTYREHFPTALCVHLLTDESSRGIVVHEDIPSVMHFLWD